MKCACCGRQWIGLEECYFCVWWGSTVLAGCDIDSIDRIIREERKRYAFSIQPTGRGNYYAVRQGSVEETAKPEPSAGYASLPLGERGFGLGQQIQFAEAEIGEEMTEAGKLNGTEQGSD